MERMKELVGDALAIELQEKSLRLYEFARDYCDQRGIILADCKFEFGIVDGKVILIDEIFTPDASRFWAKKTTLSTSRSTAWIKNLFVPIWRARIGTRTASQTRSRKRL